MVTVTFFPKPDVSLRVFFSKKKYRVTFFLFPFAFSWHMRMIYGFRSGQTTKGPFTRSSGIGRKIKTFPYFFLFFLFVLQMYAFKGTKKNQMWLDVRLSLPLPALMVTVCQTVRGKRRWHDFWILYSMKNNMKKFWFFLY